MSLGRFRSGESTRPFADINVTPLVDVMLVLVVIFIITAPLMVSSVRLDLPRSDAAVSGDAPRAVSVVIDAQGQLFLGADSVDLAALARRLRSTAASGPDTEVQLRADTGVPYGRVVEVIGTAQKAGLSRIAFVAQPATTPRSDEKPVSR